MGETLGAHTPAPDARATAAAVAVERRSDVGILAFRRADAMNSFDASVLRQVQAALQGLFDDPGVRGIVLTGEGRAFSAGADVRQFRRGLDDQSTVRWVLEATAVLHPMLRAIRESGTVVVAAVNGVAAGGGLGLALAADARIGSPEARFAAGYFGLGLSPDGGSTWLLPRLIGEQRTRRFFFDNEVMDATEALRLGLLDAVVPAPELLDRAVTWARTWGRWARHSREATKRLLVAQGQSSFGEHLEAERGLIAAAAGTRDFAEGVRAFTEKRPPSFSG